TVLPARSIRSTAIASSSSSRATAPAWCRSTVRLTAPVRTCRSAASRIRGTASASPAPKRSTSTASGRRSSSTTIQRVSDVVMNTILAGGGWRKPRDGRRRVCFPITSRAYFGRSQLLLRRLQDHPAIELEVMLAGSILLDKYSHHVAGEIESGGF